MFQIPKHYVTHISIFSTAFSLPPTTDGIEGLTENHPLILERFSKVDFKAFLRVLVPLYVNSTPSSFHKQRKELTASDGLLNSLQASPT